MITMHPMASLISKMRRMNRNVVRYRDTGTQPAICIQPINHEELINNEFLAEFEKTHKNAYSKNGKLKKR